MAAAGAPGKVAPHHHPRRGGNGEERCAGRRGGVEGARPGDPLLSNTGQPRLHRLPVGVPSLNFLLLLLIFAGSGAALWHGLVAGRFAVLPLVYIALGGFGLPGGAVYINERRLRSRGWIAAVSAAGPAMNVACLLALAALYQLLLRGGTVDLACGVGVLAPVRGVFAAQEIKPQARTLAEDRGITCLVLDYEALRGIDTSADRLF